MSLLLERLSASADLSDSSSFPSLNERTRFPHYSNKEVKSDRVTINHRSCRTGSDEAMSSVSQETPVSRHLIIMDRIFDHHFSRLNHIICVMYKLLLSACSEEGGLDTFCH